MSASFRVFSLNFEGNKLSPWPFFKGQFQLQCGIGAMVQPGSNPAYSHPTFPYHFHIWAIYGPRSAISFPYLLFGKGKIFPSRDIVTVVRNMLNGFEVLSNNSTLYKLEKWNNGKLSLPFPRIDMPNQTTVGIGAGSCGVGVILSFRDIIRSGCPPSFQWEFSDMDHLRLELMSLALQWRK